MTRPSGSAPSSRIVRPAWFSNPASVALCRVELALEQDVADHPALAGDRVERQDAGARELRAVAVAVEAAEQLVAAADGEHRGAAVDRLGERRALRGDVGRDQRLLSVLAAADVEQVVRLRERRLAEADAATSSSSPRQRRPAREHRDVAAVGVDVQVVG